MNTQANYDVTIPSSATNADITPATETPKVTSETTPPATPATETPKVTSETTPPATTMSFDEWLKIPYIKSEFDKRVAKSNKTALENEKVKEERIRNRQLTFDDRTRGLDGDKLREVTAQIFKEQQEQIEQERAQSQHKQYVMTTLSEKKLPETLIDLFEFVDETQESIDRRLSVIMDYHNVMQASYEKKLDDARKEWRGQLDLEEYGSVANKPQIENSLAKRGYEVKKKTNKT